MKEIPVARGSLTCKETGRICEVETGKFAKGRNINAVVSLAGRLEFLSLSQNLELKWTHSIPLSSGETPELARLRPRDCDHDWLIVVCATKVLALEYDEQIDDFVCRSTLKHTGGEVVAKQEGIVLLSGLRSKKTYFVSLSIPPRNPSGEHTIRERFLPMTKKRNWTPIYTDEDYIYTTSRSDQGSITRMDWDGECETANVGKSSEKYILGNLLVVLSEPIKVYELDKIFKANSTGNSSLVLKSYTFESVKDSASSRNPFDVSRKDELSALDGKWLKMSYSEASAVQLQLSDDGVLSCIYYNLWSPGSITGPELPIISSGLILFHRNQSLYSEDLVTGKVSELKAYLPYLRPISGLLSDQFGIAVTSPGLTGCSNLWYREKPVISVPRDSELTPLTSPFCPKLCCRTSYSSFGTRKIFSVGPSWILATSPKDTYVLEYSADDNTLSRTSDPWINKEEHTIDASEDIQLTANTINFIKLKSTISLSVPVKIGSVCQASVAFIDNDGKAWVCSAGEQECNELTLPEGDMKRECLLYLLALSYQHEPLSPLLSNIHSDGLIQVLRHKDWLVCSYSTGRVLIYSCLSESISSVPLNEYRIKHKRIRILSVGENVLCIANGFPRALLIKYSSGQSATQFETCWCANSTPFREICAIASGLYIFAVDTITLMELQYGKSYTSLANPPGSIDLFKLQDEYKQPILDCWTFIDQDRYLQLIKTDSIFQLVMRSLSSAETLAHVNLPSKAKFLKCFTNLQLENCKEFGFVVLVPDVKRFWEYYFPQPMYLYSLPSLKRIGEARLSSLKGGIEVPTQTYVFRQLEYFPIQRLDFALSKSSRLFYTRLRMTYPRTGPPHTLLHWGGTPSVERGNTPPHISQDQNGCWVQLGSRIFYTKFDDLTQEPNIVDELPTFKKNEPSHQSCLTPEGIYFHHMSVSETRAWAITDSALPGLGKSTLAYERPKHAETVTVPDESNTKAMTVLEKGLQARWRATAESLGSCFVNITPRAAMISERTSTIICYFTFADIELYNRLTEMTSQLKGVYNRRYGSGCSEDKSLDLDMLMDAGQRHTKLMAELDPVILTEAQNLQKLFDVVFSRA